MPLSESLEVEAWREFNSTACFCGAKKKPGMSFCKRCYFELPAKLRSALYNRFGSGYAEVWDEARDFLKIECNVKAVAKPTLPLKADR